MRKIEEVAKASVRGGFHLLVGNVISLVLMALASILIARLLGPERYGVYSISLVIPSLILTLTDFGVNPAIIRHVAKLRSEGNVKLAVKLAKVGITFKIVIGFFTTLIAIVLADKLMMVLNRTGIEDYIRIASFLIIGQTMSVTAQNVFLGFDKTEYTALTRIIQAVVKLVFTPILIFVGLGILGALLGHILSYAIAGLISLLLMWSIIYRVSDNVSSGGLKTLISYGFPLYLSIMVMNLMNNYNNIVLTWFVTNVEIGNFSVASNFLSLIGVMAMPIGTILFPAFSKFSVEKEREEVAEFFRYSVKYTSLLMVPASVLVAMLSRELVYLIYGSEYVLSPSYLSAYIVYYLLSCLGLLVLRGFFNGVGDTKMTLKLSVIMALVTAFLTPTLTMVQRVYGLIVSIIVSNLMALIYGLKNLNSKYGITIDLKSSVKVLISALIAAVPVIVVRGLVKNPILSVAASTTVYIITYLTITPLFKVLKVYELERLETTLRDIKVVKPLATLILKYEMTLIRSS